MALLFSPSFSSPCFLKLFPPPNLTNNHPPNLTKRRQRGGALVMNKTTLPHMRCLGVAINTNTLERPLLNFQPTSWTFDFVQSLDSCYSEKTYGERGKKLEDGLRIGLEDWSGRNALEMLELIDDMERLGLGYRFKNDIGMALQKIAGIGVADDNLYATSIKFRLLRQHGFQVSQNVFQRFMNNDGGFLTSHQNNLKGLLSLYEASFLGFEKEHILQEAKSFAALHLHNIQEGRHEDDSNLTEHINHVLELPTYRRAQKIEARWYIEAYSKKENADQALLELAVLDFNMVQSIFQKDLQDVSKWWKEIGLVGNLYFIRDRVVECFFWSVGMVPEPRDNKARIGLTKVYALITAIDDVYDEYGTMEELELFTYAVERWDMAAAKDLPGNIKLCFLALYNTINDMVYDTLKEQGEDISSKILTAAWTDLCQSFLREARWNKENCKPNFDDYLENAWHSVSGSVMLVHIYFLMIREIKTEALIHLENYHDLLKWSSMIFRLGNDLATGEAELERGQTVNAISCYMRETGVSAQFSRAHIRSLIDEAWKKLNEESQLSNSPFEKDFTQTVINLARIAECTYHHGDGHGDPDTRAKKRVSSVIIEPITLIG